MQVHTAVLYIKALNLRWESQHIVIVWFIINTWAPEINQFMATTNYYFDYQLVCSFLSKLLVRRIRENSKKCQ